MDTELQILRSLPSLILCRNSSTSSRPDPEIDDEHRYTSLKDIILNSPQTSTAIPEEIDFDPSTITIRNQLVKRAASAYVQSAAILACSRNQGFIVSFWARLRAHAALGSRWHVYVRSPIEACFRPILHFFACVVGNVRSTFNIPIS